MHELNIHHQHLKANKNDSLNKKTVGNTIAHRFFSAYCY
jgi:hypothetical protein